MAQVRTRVVLLSLCGVVGFESWGPERWIWGIVDSYMPSHVSGLASRIEAELGCRLPDSALVRCDDCKEPNAGMTGDGVDKRRMEPSPGLRATVALRRSGPDSVQHATILRSLLLQVRPEHPVSPRGSSNTRLTQTSRHKPRVCNCS